MSLYESIIIFAAEYLVFFQLFAAAIIVWYFRRKRVSIFRYAFMSGVMSFVLSRIASAMYDNPRPFVEEEFMPLVTHATDNGFPSDHTLLAGWLAAVVFVLDRRAGVILALSAFGIGLARVMAGVHHLEDVVASLVIVVVSAILARSKFLLG